MSARPVRLRRIPTTPDDHERQRDQAQEVEARLRPHVDHAEQVGALDAWRGQPVEARAVAEDARAQQPRGGRQPEREGDDGEGEAAPAQHGQADERGERGPDHAGAEQTEREVPTEARGERRADRRADGDERHLPEADLAGPTGEHDQRERDDRRTPPRPRRGWSGSR